MKVTAGSNGVFGPWTSALRAQAAQSSITVRCTESARIQIGVGPSGAEAIIADVTVGAGTGSTTARQINPGDRIAVRAISASVGMIDIEVSSAA